MELDVAERLLGLDVAGAVHLGAAVLDLPLRRAAAAAPLRQILAIEENDRVGGGTAGLLGRRVRAGGDDLRPRSRGIVHVPLAARKHRRVGVAEVAMALLERGRRRR